MESVSKEAFVAYFNMRFRKLSVVTEGNHKNLSQCSRYLGPDLNPWLPEYEA
jgi:hypothetical protein